MDRQNAIKYFYNLRVIITENEDLNLNSFYKEE